LAERGQEFPARPDVEGPDHRHRRLLSAGSERPRHRRAAKKRDEFARRMRSPDESTHRRSGAAPVGISALT
jgi:hypothetical protein